MRGQGPTEASKRQTCWGYAVLAVLALLIVLAALYGLIALLKIIGI
jgi:hypothetical protein